MNQIPSIRIRPGADVVGTGLVEEFDLADSEKVTLFAKQYIETTGGDKRAKVVLKRMLADTKEADGYSRDSLPMQCGGFLFTLYSNCGRWRLGGFGSLADFASFQNELKKVKDFVTTVN